jgi:hypothetical protein
LSPIPELHIEAKKCAMKALLLLKEYASTTFLGINAGMNRDGITMRRYEGSQLVNARNFIVQLPSENLHYFERNCECTPLAKVSELQDSTIYAQSHQLYPWRYMNTRRSDDKFLQKTGGISFEIYVPEDNCRMSRLFDSNSNRWNRVF